MQAKRIDWFILASVAMLVVYGILFVGSAQDEGSSRLLKQLLWCAVGTVAFLGTIYIDYKIIMRHAYLLFAFSILALVLVLFTRPINNATSWFDLKILRVQPSEFVKLIWVLAMARLLSFNDSYKRLSGLWLPLGLSLLPLALILKQPDLGTAMVFIPALFAMLFAAGSRLKHLGLIIGSGAAASALLWTVFMHAYQKRRIFAWLYPDQYSTREAYQFFAARTAIGTGGWWGMGLGRGMLNNLNTVPVKDTDMILSVIAEEWGFIGCVGLLIIFSVFVFSCLSLAKRTREPQGRLVVIGVTSLLAYQAVVNLWVATGLFPTTGVTLPFVSYGGSSLLSSFIGVGLIVNVGMQQHRSIAPDNFSV